MVRATVSRGTREGFFNAGTQSRTETRLKERDRGYCGCLAWATPNSGNQTMKTLTSAAVVAALIGSIALAQAQTAPTTKSDTSPASINKGSQATKPSGSEAQSTATGQSTRISGAGKFCKETSANGPLSCIYASMSDCQKGNTSNNLHCVANPRFGTTGSK